MTSIAEHAIRKQEAFEERRRCRLSQAIREAAITTGYVVDKDMARFLSVLLSKLELDAK